MAANDEIIRNFSLYANGKKFGQATSLGFDQQSGRELQIIDGKVGGISQGVKTTQAQADSIVPFGGAPVLRILQDYYNSGKKLQIGVGSIGGQIHKIDMWVQEINYKAEMKNGTTTGTFKFIGGEATQVG